jgi:hypothetical protein
VEEFLSLCQDLQLRNRNGMHPDWGLLSDSVAPLCIC